MTDTIIKPIEAIIAETKEQIQPYIFKRLEKRTPRKAGEKVARTIAITSGKGGVGKTSLVANMAIALAQAGQKVIILDADLGMANIDVVFGIRPKYNIMDVLDGRMTLDEAMVQGPNGIQIIAGGSGVVELAQLEGKSSERLFEQLKFLEDKTDCLLIDTGAGIGNGVISFCVAADQVIVITTTEPTAMADAYGIIKVINNIAADKHVSVLVNKVEEPDEGEYVFAKLQKVAKDFLGFQLHFLGSIAQDRKMHLAVRQQTPLLLFAPMSPAASAIRKMITRQLLHLPDIEAAVDGTHGVEGFFTKLANFLQGEAVK